MKQLLSTLSALKYALIGLFLVHSALAQGYDDPLTFQGIDHSTIQSAASRALGSTTIGLQNDVGLMFSNPASLQSLKGAQISVGGVQQFEQMTQVQQYAPLKYYANFSLLMEGLTNIIRNPDTSFHVTNPNAGDTVQRPYDKIGPNWSHSKNKGQPIQALLSVPFAIGQLKMAAGLGVVQYADLNHYYENHNVLNPSIGSERPVPVELPASDSVPYRTQWSSFLRSREGSITGYGIALSCSLSDRISFGVSGMALKGSTDDYEQHIARGTLVFYKNWFILDSVDGWRTKTGTSDYSGQEFTFSGIYGGRYVSLGFSVKPPMTITRSYARQVLSDTAGSLSVATERGQDKLSLPWRGTFGLSVAVRDDIRLGLEYEVRSYASAVYTDTGGKESNLWLSSSALHLGAEYSPMTWLSLRVGVRGQSEVFEETGNPMPGEPVTYSVYSAGCGISLGNARLNLAYEYAPMKYQDMWQANVNLNNSTRHTIHADIVWEIPQCMQ